MAFPRVGYKFSENLHFSLNSFLLLSSFGKFFFPHMNDFFSDVAGAKFVGDYIVSSESSFLEAIEGAITPLRWVR